MERSRANGEVQHCRGCAGAPEDLAAEGKTILTLRHKSADELERQLSRSPHTDAACRNMPMHASKIWADEMLGPKQTQQKSSIHQVGTATLAFMSFSVWLLGMNMKNVAKKKTACLLSAMCHLSSYQQSETGAPLCLFNTSEAKREKRSARPRIPQSVEAIPQDVAHSSTRAYVARWRAALSSSTELLF